MEKKKKQEVERAVKQVKKGRGEKMETGAVLTKEKKLQAKKKVTKHAEKQKDAQIEKAMVPKKETMKLNEHAGWEKAMVETDKTDVEEKNADAVATSFEQVKNYLCSVIEMD